jgi:hypothetical protein
MPFLDQLLYDSYNPIRFFAYYSSRVVSEAIMFKSNPRGTAVLYLVLAAVIAALVLSNAVAPFIGAALIAAYMLLLWGTARPQSIQQIPEAVPQVMSRVRRPRITAQAKEATSLARRGASYYNEDYLLQDVGMIIDEREHGGLRLHHTRSASLDEESIRPYLVLYHQGYPHQIVVRFEMKDAAGHVQFVYEMEHMLRPGENLILPDYRLRLRGNDRLTRTGTWDLAISVDGIVMGMHHFTVAPSTTNRRLHNTPRTYEDGELPLSLEELLRQNQG